MAKSPREEILAQWNAMSEEQKRKAGGYQLPTGWSTSGQTGQHEVYQSKWVPYQAPAAAVPALPGAAPTMGAVAQAQAQAGAPALQTPYPTPQAVPGQAGQWSLPQYQQPQFQTPDTSEVANLLYQRMMAQVSGDLGQRGLASSSIFGAASARASAEAQLASWQLAENMKQQEFSNWFQTQGLGAQYGQMGLESQRIGLQGQQVAQGWAGLGLEEQRVGLQGRALGFEQERIQQEWARIAQQRETTRLNWNIQMGELSQSDFWNRLGYYARQAPIPAPPPMQARAQPQGGLGGSMPDAFSQQLAAQQARTRQILGPQQASSVGGYTMPSKQSLIDEMTGKQVRGW